MKGPYERLKYDLRRVWECADCHHRERSSGSVTTVWCSCQQAKETRSRVAMRLVEDDVRRVRATASPSAAPAVVEPAEKEPPGPD